MAKAKKNKAKQSKQRSPQPVNQRERAMCAFQSGNFNEALRILELQYEHDPSVGPLIAETLLRRTLSPSKIDAVADLRRALELVPNDLSYTFHLGRLLHHDGDYAAAEAYYREVLAQDPNHEAAARLLVLLKLEQNPQTEVSQLPYLSPAIEKWLAPAHALLHKQPFAHDTSPLGMLWQGLFQLAAGDPAATKSLADDRSLPSAALHRIRRHYRGLAAAAAGDLATAQKHWTQLFDTGARPPGLEAQLSWLLYEQLLELWENEKYQEAAELAKRWQTLKGSAAFDELRVLALDRAAHLHVAQREWPQAIQNWQAAREIVGNSQAKSLGSPRPLLHNLALAYEQLEHWNDAAENWRALLRFRPRKRNDTDETLENKRWAWVRKRLIKCYHNADNPEEAINIFRQMIKAEPDDIDLRLDLASALYDNKQDAAAKKELKRALQIEPHHPEATVRYAMMLSDAWQMAEAQRLVKLMVNHHADNPDARRKAGEVCAYCANEYIRYGNLHLAHNAFVEAEQHDPTNGIYPIQQARMLFFLKRPVDVAAKINHALELESKRVQVWQLALETWLIIKDIAQAEALWPRYRQICNPSAQQIRDISIGILVKIIPPPSDRLLRSGVAPTPVDTPEVRFLHNLIQEALELSNHDIALYTQVIEVMLLPLYEHALHFAEQALEHHPNDPALLLNKSIALSLCNRTQDAKAVLQQAGQLARKQGRADIQAQVRDIRPMIGTPELVRYLSMPITGGFDDTMFDLDDLDDLDEIDLKELEKMLKDML
ncbi:tetratricopeptide repeat protein [Candidatus Viridilinea mediisalina]|uniref:Tetratricopeptide repeat protein n=1 Tax=Candidatus Viridilinea mediisalina TaxID=2024553 RepID=A0A2A6RN95_9CHLR|nr:tetratricopeptide repeat protein [Candidatus Viridilinea mediisalina]PDW04507.1 hypothetical protein CJ255_03050 [Candidatus Viridilinea mediisalina]